MSHQQWYLAKPVHEMTSDWLQAAATGVLRLDCLIADGAVRLRLRTGRLCWRLDWCVALLL